MTVKIECLTDRVKFIINKNDNDEIDILTYPKTDIYVKIEAGKIVYRFKENDEKVPGLEFCVNEIDTTNEDIDANEIWNDLDACLQDIPGQISNFSMFTPCVGNVEQFAGHQVSRLTSGGGTLATTTFIPQEANEVADVRLIFTASATVGAWAYNALAASNTKDESLLTTQGSGAPNTLNLNANELTYLSVFDLFTDIDAADTLTVRFTNNDGSNDLFILGMVIDYN